MVIELKRKCLCSLCFVCFIIVILLHLLYDMSNGTFISKQSSEGMDVKSGIAEHKISLGTLSDGKSLRNKKFDEIVKKERKSNYNSSKNVETTKHHSSSTAEKNNPTSNLKSSMGITESSQEQTLPVTKSTRKNTIPTVSATEANPRQPSDWSSSITNDKIPEPDLADNNKPNTVCQPQATFAEDNSKYKRVVDVDASSGADKTILLWNPLFAEDTYGLALGHDTFDSCHCPVRCWLTRDRTLLPRADAVVIHTFYLAVNNVTLPERAFDEQIFVFFLLESPLVSCDGYADYDYMDYFNITMTYLDHPDTDIYSPVGDFVTPVPDHDPRVPSWQTVNSKSRLIAWLVSNCEPYSARATYVDKLSEHVQVDIYGECGNLTCPKGDDYGTECLVNISKQYLFYVAFENSYCDGYITEKVYRIMQFDLVPIVYGGANYSAMLPPKSYIDVHDFQSPEHLANHLNFLNEHRDKYMEYFAWRRSWVAVADYYHRARGFCRLCQILHSTNYPYKAHFDVVSYWDPIKLCSNATEEKRAVHL